MNVNRENHPSNSTMFGRGLIRHCSACGQGKLFRRWLTMVERCPRCGLKFERIEGHWIGAIGINTIVSFATLLVLLVTSIAVSYPDFDLVKLIVFNCAVVFVVPVFCYPFSKTVWTGIDLMMRPLQDDEVDWTQLSQSGNPDPEPNS